jgi:glycine cleavage system H protein
MTPHNLLYTADHGWLRLEGEEAVVGITDHAQKALGELTFIELPKVGRAVKARGPLAVVESVKAASEVLAPVSGVVAAVNTALAKAPETINASPYDRGWICRLSGLDRATLGGLMDAEQYAKQFGRAR